jgi:hypothetical protein
MLLMHLDGPGTRLANGQANLVKERFRHAAAPGHGGGDEPRRTHVRRQRRECHLDSGHL